MKLRFALAILPLLFTQSLMAKSGVSALPDILQVKKWTGSYGAHFPEADGNGYTTFSTDGPYSWPNLNVMTLDFTSGPEGIVYEWDRPELGEEGEGKPNPLETDDKTCRYVVDKSGQKVPKTLPRKMVFVDSLEAKAGEAEEAGQDNVAKALMAQAAKIKASKDNPKSKINHEVIGVILGYWCVGDEKPLKEDGSGDVDVSKLKPLQAPIVDIQVTEEDGEKVLKMIAVLGIDPWTKSRVGFSTYELRPVK